MATNADEDVVDSNAEVTETDLRNLKYAEDGVETSQKEEDEPTEVEEVEETEQESSEEVTSDDSATEEPDGQSAEPPEFVKEFPHIKGDTPEEYAKNLEAAYRNSTTEALRLKKLSEATQSSAIVDDVEDEVAPVKPANDPVTKWVNSQIDKEITKAYKTFQTEYPQVLDQEKYDQFVAKVAIFSKTIIDSEDRQPDPAEVYQLAATSLGWEKQSVPSKEEKLGMAIKQNASSAKVSASGAKPPAKSKVTDAHIAAYRNMTNSTLSDAEIRKELEIHTT